MDWNKQDEYGIGHNQKEIGLHNYTLWCGCIRSTSSPQKGGFKNGYDPHFICWRSITLGRRPFQDWRRKTSTRQIVSNEGPRTRLILFGDLNHWDRNSCSIWIDQQAYLENALKRFELQDANNTKTPLPAGIHLEKSEEPVALDTKTYYQQILGTLIYAAIGTRPDIEFVATRLSRFNNNPTEEHIKYARYVLRYLKAQKSSKSNMMELQMLG